MKESVLAGTEDVGADTDHGGAMANGKRPISRHADGELVKKRKPRPTDKMEKSLDAGKLGVYPILIFRIGCHSHQASDSDRFFDTLRMADRKDFFFGEALLAFFCAQVEFQEDIHSLAIGPGPFGNGLQQMKGIYGLYQRDIRKNQLQLIGLQVANKMPLYIGGHLRDLCGQLLGTALGKDTLPCLIGFHQPLHRMEFGNCHQLNG